MLRLQQLHVNEHLSPSALTASFNELKADKRSSPTRSDKRHSFSFGLANVGFGGGASTTVVSSESSPSPKTAALTAAAAYANRIFKGGFSGMHSTKVESAMSNDEIDDTPGNDGKHK